MRETERIIWLRILRRVLVGVTLVATCVFPGMASAGVSPWVAAAALAESPPQTPTPPEPPDTSDWDLKWDTDSDRDVVRMGEDIRVEPGERVRGDVVSIGGKVIVYGHVGGDVVSVGGGLELKSGCVIEGDAVCVGGTIEREEGAIIRGQDVSVGVLPGSISKTFRGLGIGRHTHQEASALKIWWDLLRYLGFFGIGMILFLAFPDRMNAIRSTVRSRFWLSLVTGFGSILGALVLLVLLVITCIGILVAVPGIFVSILATVGGGAAAISLFGQLLLRRTGSDRSAWLVSLLAGLAAMFVLQILGRLLVLTGGAGDVIGSSILGIVKFAWTILLLTGLGSLVLSRFGKPEPTIPRPAWEIYNRPAGSAALPPGPGAGPSAPTSGGSSAGLP